MSVVWVVTEGSYEDYGIVNVHSTKQKVEAWVASQPRRLRNSYMIEEHEFDPEPNPRPNRWSGSFEEKP